MWRSLFSFACGLLVCLLGPAGVADEPRPDLVIEDFEHGSYDRWKIEGDAFGAQPAQGTLPRQNPVSGFAGQYLVNTYHQGDKSTGVATSSPFTIERPYLAFLIGGGDQEASLALQLLVDDQVVHTATGHDSEDLVWAAWDVKPLVGQQATLRIVDRATGGWGHLSVDQIVQSDAPPRTPTLEERLAQYRQSAEYMREPLRPQFHFSPEIFWTNDPNGLVYFDGEYHLFYQYNPQGNRWGHMSWGHAVSPDLLHWTHLPLAIPEEAGVMAFSGSCVVDHQNSSGFGVGNAPPMVAIYTGHGHGKQVQNLAYSNDRGRTWTRYAGNPVLDLNNADFRDPKVFWHQPTSRWVMVVSLAVEKVIVLYGSQDLKHWTELSRFGPAGTINKPNWECPDLFELPVEGEPGKTLWVLETDMGDGSVAGGSGGEYFVGHFDGTRFQAIQQAQWVDYGRDFYAPISFDNVPASDGRRIWMGWLNNWQTSLSPTSPWRGSMSLPRKLSLRRVALNREEPATYVLVQRPVDELATLREQEVPLDASQVSWPPTALTQPGQLRDGCFELQATLRPGESRSLGFRLRTGDDEYTEIAYDRFQGGVYVDRTKSGNVSFHEAFPGRHTAPARLIDGAIRLRMIVDRNSIELFIHDGETVISDLIFPTRREPVIEAFVGHPSASIENVTLAELRSVWGQATQSNSEVSASKPEATVSNNADAESLRQELPGAGAAEPASPAAWYGEGVRPTDKRTPEQERLGFHVPPGFVVELVAAEPEIAKPLNMAFDPRGRLWLTQTVEYPYPAQDRTAARDAIKVLEDTDQDGTFDDVRTFAEGLNIPMGLLPYADGVIAFSIPNLWFLRDTDGDGRCDTREKILGPFDTSRDTHGMVNALRRGDDGWIYACHGFSNQSVVKGRDGHEVRLTSGNTFRFRADGSRIEAYTAGQVNPFGMTSDRYGNRITADCHSKPLTALFPGACYPSFGRPDDGLGFYPSMMDHAHGSTAISGVSLYDASPFPEAYQGQLFSGNVMTSRINRNRLVHQGATLQAQELADFLTSDDPWFRPVDIQLGPDGALYVADFYNRIIGHYEVPLEHPGRDRDSGRLWRIRHQTRPLEPLRVVGESLDATITELESANATRRQLALDALTDSVQQTGKTASANTRQELTTAIRKLLQTGNDVARVKAMWWLYRVGEWDQQTLADCLADPSPVVQTHALKLFCELEQSADTRASMPAASVRESLRALLNHPHAEVATWAAQGLAACGDESDLSRLVQKIVAASDQDSMARSRWRIALRDLLAKHPAWLNGLQTRPWSPEERLTVLQVALGIASPAIAEPLLLAVNQMHTVKEATPWLKQIAKWGDESQQASVVAWVREHSLETAADKHQSDLAMVLEMRPWFSGQTPAALQTWAEQSVAQVLSRRLAAANQQHAAISWTSVDGSTWPLEKRTAEDATESLYRSSFPRGESYQGKLRSGEFVCGNSLSFWIAGHLGFPTQASNRQSRLRLVDSASGEELASAWPPRNDRAQQVTWDLAPYAGRRVHLEAIDGDNGTAYAWFAFARFSDERLNAAEQAAEWASALSLVNEFRLMSLQEPLRQLAAHPSLDSLTRLLAMSSGAKLMQDAPAEITAAWLIESNADAATKERCLEQFVRSSPSVTTNSRSDATIYRELVRELAIKQPRRGQIQLGRRLAANQEVAGWLVDAMTDGWLAKDLLHDKVIATALETTLDKDAKARLQNLKRGLPSADDVAIDLVQRLAKLALSSPGDSTRGQVLFQKQCAVCHQLAGQGALVGPQLDGVGARNAERLLEDILVPDRNVDKAFRSTSLLMEDGAVQVGLIRAETATEIELIDGQGKTIRLATDQVAERSATDRSLMPAGHHDLLGDAGLLDLIAYLQSVK